jgi:hypothetical protein
MRVAVIVAAVAATEWLAAWWRARTAEDEQDARAWCARLGWRIRSHILYRVEHEDNEGWWTGSRIGWVPNYRYARELLIRTGRAKDTR